ncbi:MULTISPECIES: histidinol dehydrogenase [Brevibacterium]|uniref:Histidinol dehydrogenase n=1 Tax=Brevibacterium pityocampae TaxID=506594 RepID=A0ABP8JFF3_9MICO|nr:histidinol dehydrogenase [Brevibacterium sp. CS2]
MTTSPINRLDLRDSALDRRTLRASVPRAQVDLSDAVAAVGPLLAAVREHGRSAVLEYTERFDRVALDTVRVPAAELTRAAAELDPRIRAALEETIRRTRAVAAADARPPVTTSFDGGGTVTTRWLPVDRVGLYVPGGLAVYPSTVVMNVVPAQVAGVASLAIASPPQSTGLPHPTVMAAAAMLGVEEVWAMGGAQAVAAFAHGFDDGEVLEPVDLITGPGNAFVAAAKASVRSVVGIDSVAGPTEIIVLADDTADPRFVAADLISQAEHDPQAASVLVTASEALADAVAAELAAQVPAAAHRERIAEALAGPQSGIVLVRDLDAGIAVLNAYAGEHVQLMVAEPRAVAERVTNGGAVFLGDHSPVALGDYCAGSNHVLPTMGNAAHASALGIQSFLKGSQVIDYPAPALAAVADHIVALAADEDLPAHGAAVSLRFAADEEN